MDLWFNEFHFVLFYTKSLNLWYMLTIVVLHFWLDNVAEF